MSEEYAYGERRCNVCDSFFLPRQGLEKTCFPCWRDKKTRADFAERVRIVRVDVPVLRVDPRLPDVDNWQTMLMRLIKLAHPDRHGGSQEANDVTRWLLEERRKFQGMTR